MRVGKKSVQSLGYETEIILLSGLKKGDLLVNGNLSVPEDDNSNRIVVLYGQANNHNHYNDVSTKGIFID